LYERLDELVSLLSDLGGAVNRRDAAAVGAAAVAFASVVTTDSFFAPSRLPDDWQAKLTGWVSGVAFREILDGARVQAFIQDGVIFKLVWAAEAVRVQAAAIGHARVNELGDGPAFSLTYGVPSIEAALLCQTGFSSRVGATWVARQLGASFSDVEGMHEWMARYDAVLSDPEFWESEDQHLMWSVRSSDRSDPYPTQWERQTYEIDVAWQERPAAGTVVRIVPTSRRHITVCSDDLVTLGTGAMPVDAEDALLEGVVIDDRRVLVVRFGTPQN
jgi:hypothetical protein